PMRRIWHASTRARSTIGRRPATDRPRASKNRSKARSNGLMTRYRTDLTDIDLATHSPFELFAWCLSRHGATYDEAADKARKAAEDLLLLIDELPNDPTPGDPARADLIEEHQ